MNHLVLKGCTPVPLAAYLKALGVLRLVAEQADPGAAGWWQADRFVLRSRLDREGLRRFFLEDYRPASIVAPWNGGSGFYPRDNRKGIDPLGAAAAARFAPLRQTIGFARQLLEEMGISEKPGGNDKARLLRRFRSEAPEPALRWFNAAVVLSGDDPAYPPLLGTGGNDGRLDFTNNFLQRLVGLFDPETGEPRDRAGDWLDHALFGKAVSGLEKGAIGQFHPGAAGGPNATTGFSADSLTNPWDFVLMLEGALAFAAAVSRRLEAAGGEGLSFPFTVRPTTAGAGTTVPEELASARAEIWVPLWDRPARWQELERFLAEGRIRLGRRTARDGLDFMRALATLGVDRGIEGFERYAFLMRSGKAYLAAPQGRIKVRRNPDADLIADLEQGGFLDRVRPWPRDENLPASVRQAAWNLEQALFRLAERGGPHRVQEALAALGELARAMAHFHKKGSRDRDLRPALPRLGPGWLLRADDRSDDFRLAAAVAGLGTGSGLPLACQLLPVVLKGGRWHWQEEAPEWRWREEGLVSGLAAATSRRLLLAERGEHAFDALFRGMPGCSATALARWLERDGADRRIERLVRGLALVGDASLPPLEHEDAQALPAAWWVLRAQFIPDEMLCRAGLLSADGHLPRTLRLPALLMAGRIEEAVRGAWQALSAHGAQLPPMVRPPALFMEDGARLLASLAIPLDPKSLHRGLRLLSVETEPMEELA